MVKTLSVICEGQKQFGKQIDIAATLAYYRLKLERRFTVDQVIYALDKYTDTRNDIPAPADILAILNPPKPRITEAAFIEAQKWQERNNFPVFSDAKDTIEAYKAQESDKQDSWKCENEQILAISSNTFKRIGQ